MAIRFSEPLWRNPKAGNAQPTAPEHATATSLMPQPTIREAIEAVRRLGPGSEKIREELESRILLGIELAQTLGRPKSGKVIVTLRLDPDVLAALKADGAGWQPRANALLRKALSL